jgi:ankyrin repeat protein
MKCTDTNCTSNDLFSKTPLIFAANNGHEDVVRVLLEGGANADMTNNLQQTALHYTAWNGNLDMCRLLLDLGAKVDPLDKWKDSPLHSAAWGGNLLVVKLLVERGTDVRLKNGVGETASEKARSEGNTDVADWLDSVGRV